MRVLGAIVKALRPKHWIKNIFVFAALIFADRFTDLPAVVLTISAFWLFSCAASAVYLINDIADYEADKKHPVKKYRAIASGRLGRGVALVISLLLVGGALLTAVAVSPYLAVILLVYFINNLFYTFCLKRVVILDVLMIACGYVLRAVGGAIAIDVSISPWFLIIIFLLTLFLAIMKRRQEFVEVSKNGGTKRKVLDSYSVEMLDQMANIVMPAVLVCYIFFTFNTFHTQYFMLTIPFVIYGIFRYLFLVHKKDMGENPTEVLLTDIPMAVTVMLWGAICLFLIYAFE